MVGEEISAVHSLIGLGLGITHLTSCHSWYDFDMLYNFACSCASSGLRSGPLRLPSLQTIGAPTPSAFRSLHFCLICSAAFSSKQPAI
jgi:hypothetical protein